MAHAEPFLCCYVAIAQRSGKACDRTRLDLTFALCSSPAGRLTCQSISQSACEGPPKVGRIAVEITGISPVDPSRLDG